MEVLKSIFSIYFFLYIGIAFLVCMLSIIHLRDDRKLQFLRRKTLLLAVISTEMIILIVWICSLRNIKVVYNIEAAFTLAFTCIISIVIVSFLLLPFIVLHFSIGLDGVVSKVLGGQGDKYEKSYDIAEMFESRHDYEKAMEFYMKEALEDPKDYEALRRSAEIRYKQERLEECCALLLKALERARKDGRNGIVLRLVDIYQLKLKTPEEAVKLLEQQLRMSLSEQDRKNFQKRLDSIRYSNF